MKKTLAALIVGAFAASAANAAVVYNNEGSKVEVDGSLRFVLEKSNQSGIHQISGTKRHTHSGLRNDGSRVGVRVKHELGEGYYALGRLEFRLDGNKKSTDGFGDLYTKRAYVGLGHQDLGEVTFGRQVTIADDASTADDYSYGIISKGDYIPTDGNAVVRYAYKGIKDLQIGLSYQFADSRGNNNEVSSSTAEVGTAYAKVETVKDEKGNAQQVITKVDQAAAKYVVKNAFQIGAIYNKALNPGFVGKLVYGHTDYSPVKGETLKHRKDGVLASVGYNFASEEGKELVFSLDGGYAKDKTGDESTKAFFVSPGFRAHVTDLSRVYGNYKYEQSKDHEGAKTKQHGLLLGVDYQIHKQVVTYVEGKYQVTKDYAANGQYKDGSKVKDKAIGVGMRVFF